MDAKGPAEMVFPREIPILQPLSRFAGGICNSEAIEPRNGRSKSPNKKIPMMIRCVTPSQRPSSSSSSTVSSNAETKNSSNTRTVPAAVHQLNHKAIWNSELTADGDLRIPKRSTATKNVVNESRASNKSNVVDQRDRNHTRTADFLSSSSMAMGRKGLKGEYSKTNIPTTTSTSSSTSTLRGTQIAPCFPNDKPPANLRTEQRSTSACATRGRGRASSTSSHYIQKAADYHQPAAAVAAPKPRRQSCSPSISRGRKVLEATLQVQETTGNTVIHGNLNASQKGKIQTGNGTQVMGSRMVQRVMNARKAVTHFHEEKDNKISNSRFLINESSGVGRVSVPKSTMDIALKYKVAQQIKRS